MLHPREVQFVQERVSPFPSCAGSMFADVAAGALSSDSGPNLAAPACSTMFVQLDVPAELHCLQLSLLSFAPLSFRPGLQFVNKVLISDLLPEVLCRSLLQIQLRFSLPRQNKVSGNMEQHLIQLPLQPSPQGSCAPLAVGIGLQEILRYMICVHAFCCLFTSHRFPSR